MKLAEIPKLEDARNEMAHNNPRPVSSEEIQRVRRIAARSRASTACQPCKAAKSKCRDCRPCTRCVKMRIEAKCCDEESSRDYSYSMPLSKRFRESVLTDADISLPNEILRRIAQCWWQHGYRISDICSVLRSVPEGIRQVLTEILEDMIRRSDAALQIFSDCTPLHQWQAEQTSDLDEAFWATVEYCGYLKYTYVPGQMKIDKLFLNSAFAEFAGLSREEFSTRLAARVIPIANQLDWFCWMVDDLLRHQESAEVTRYMRMGAQFCRPGTSGAIMVAVTTRKLFYGDGNIREMHMTISRATEEEYNDMLHRSPDLCRPLAAAMGDFRSAEQCLADYDKDTSKGLEDLYGPAGFRLAAAVRARKARLSLVKKKPMKLEDSSMI